jgi:hypothetical protein
MSSAGCRGRFASRQPALGAQSGGKWQVRFRFCRQPSHRLDKWLRRNEAQRSLQARATAVATDLAQTRFLVSAQASDPIPAPFLVILVFWLAMIFASLSLFAPPNATIVVILFVLAMSASGAIFLILDLSQPFSGLMTISSAPLRNALASAAPR